MSPEVRHWNPDGYLEHMRREFLPASACKTNSWRPRERLMPRRSWISAQALARPHAAYSRPIPAPA